MARTAAAFVRVGEINGCLRLGDEPHAVAPVAPSSAAVDARRHSAEAGYDTPLVKRDSCRHIRVSGFESEPCGPARARRTFVVGHCSRRPRARGCAASSVVIE